MIKLRDFVNIFLQEGILNGTEVQTENNEEWTNKIALYNPKKYVIYLFFNVDQVVWVWCVFLIANLINTLDN